MANNGVDRIKIAVSESFRTLDTNNDKVFDERDKLAKNGEGEFPLLRDLRAAEPGKLTIDEFVAIARRHPVELARLFNMLAVDVAVRVAQNKEELALLEASPKANVAGADRFWNVLKWIFVRPAVLLLAGLPVMFGMVSLDRLPGFSPDAVDRARGHDRAIAHKKNEGVELQKELDQLGRQRGHRDRVQFIWAQIASDERAKGPAAGLDTPKAQTGIRTLK